MYRYKKAKISLDICSTEYAYSEIPDHVPDTFLSVSLRLLSGTNGSSDGCFGSQQGRAKVWRTRTMQLFVHVGLYGSQPRK